jgi:hypothetical protein
MARCYACGAILPEKIGRSTSCTHCGKEAKVCLNCRFYEKGLQWDCRERIDEPVREKDRANFCGFFAPEVKRTEASGKKDERGGEDAKRAFSKLFSDEH